MNLHLAEGYVENLAPTAHDDMKSDGLCQQAVYDYALLQAKLLNCARVVDFGCGSAKKLLPHADRFDIIGIDLENIVDQLRGYESMSDPYEEKRVRGFTTRAHDFSQGMYQFRSAPSAMLICADVIEHLVDPKMLLSSIRYALRRGAARAVISTPCRQHCPGISKKGPPNNPAHVREWTCKEFLELMAEAGLHVVNSLHVPERPDAEGKGTFLVEVVDGP